MGIDGSLRVLIGKVESGTVKYFDIKLWMGGVTIQGVVVPGSEYYRIAAKAAIDKGNEPIASVFTSMADDLSAEGYTEGEEDGYSHIHLLLPKVVNGERVYIPWRGKLEAIDAFSFEKS